MLITAALSGLTLEVPPYTEDIIKNKEFVQKNPMKFLPMLEVSEGVLVETNSILIYLAQFSDSPLYRGTLEEKAVIDEWLEKITCSFEVSVMALLYPVWGYAPFESKIHQQALNDTKNFLEDVEQKLTQSRYLVGDRLTLADLSLACTLVWPFRAVLDESFRNGLPRLLEWFNTVASLPEFVKEFGAYKFCSKALAAFEPPKVEKPKKKAEDSKKQKAKPAESAKTE